MKIVILIAAIMVLLVSLINYSINKWDHGRIKERLSAEYNETVVDIDRKIVSYGPFSIWTTTKDHRIYKVTTTSNNAYWVKILYGMDIRKE